MRGRLLLKTRPGVKPDKAKEELGVNKEEGLAGVVFADLVRLHGLLKAMVDDATAPPPIR